MISAERTSVEPASPSARPRSRHRAGGSSGRLVATGHVVARPGAAGTAPLDVRRMLSLQALAGTARRTMSSRGRGGAPPSGPSCNVA